MREAKEYGFDINAAEHGFNWKSLKDKRDAYIKRLNGIYERNLNNDKVEYLHGHASFVNKNTVKIQNGDSVSEVQAKKILVAVGKWDIQFLWLMRLTVISDTRGFKVATQLSQTFQVPI